MERSISQELLVELWSRIALKKVYTMKLVSKHWATLIDSSANFIASRQPRVLYTYVNGRGIRKFRSVSLRLVCPKDGRRECVEFPADIEVSSTPVNGLMCVRSDESTRCNIQICNFFTGKSLRLPELPKNFCGDDSSFFLGCLKSSHQFKVLCVRVEKTPREVLVMPQVFSLKGKSPSWRGISCGDPHLPINSKSGMCKDGVIYYAAWNVNRELLVMSFNLESEVFSPIYLGDKITEMDHMSIQMMNYDGDVSLVIRQPLPDGTDVSHFDIRIMKNGQGWDSTYFMIHGLEPHYRPLFCNSNGDVVFAPGFLSYHLHLNTVAAFRKSFKPTEKAKLGLSLRNYEANKKGDILIHYYHPERDSCTDVFDPYKHYVDVQFFLGTVSFINPEELLE